MANSKVLFYDGKKAVDINSLPPEAWITLSGNGRKADAEKLYSVVAHLYRCVTIIGNSVASMPFEIRQGDSVVYTFDGMTAQDDPPRNLQWVDTLPELLGQVSTANMLCGRAYLQDIQSVLGTTMKYKWLVPWSVTPNYNKTTGELINFTRTYETASRPPEPLTIDEVIQFWLPDYAVEDGPAINYPGAAVLQNAGVVNSLDTFLTSYFDRGLVAAGFLSYDGQIDRSDKKRIKAWWDRMTSGLRSAFNNLVVRGDFKYTQVGNGIKDLRDNKLTQDEKDSIAVGLGVPPSKLLPVGVNRATKDGDDRGYIEETIIPEIQWIYRVCNDRMFNPAGYSIVALPQRLRVMQSDEVERANAFRAYVGNGQDGGLPVETAVEVLGISIPDGFSIGNEPPVIESEKSVEQAKSTVAVDYMAIVDKRDERDRFLRWLDKRKGTAVSIDDFSTEHLTGEEKYSAYQKWQNDLEIDGLINNYAKAMEQLNEPAEQPAI